MCVYRMLSDMNSDGKLDKLEFSIAMYLIKKKLSRVELPRTLPASLKLAPAPAMPGFGVQPIGEWLAPVNALIGSSPKSIWDRSISALCYFLL